MRKTTAGRALLGIVNIMFVAIAASAIISAVPPQYSLQITPIPSSPTPTILSIPVRFNVTNNGFYDINNFYVRMIASDPSGNSLNQTETPHVTIARSTAYSYTVILNLNYTYIQAHHGTYSFVLRIHSEFALGLIKFTVDAPMAQTLPLP
jgi:hypothetical protein